MTPTIQQLKDLKRKQETSQNFKETIRNLIIEPLVELGKLQTRIRNNPVQNLSTIRSRSNKDDGPSPLGIPDITWAAHKLLKRVSPSSLERIKGQERMQIFNKLNC